MVADSTLQKRVLFHTKPQHEGLEEHAGDGERVIRTQKDSYTRTWLFRAFSARPVRVTVAFFLGGVSIGHVLSAVLYSPTDIVSQRTLFSVSDYVEALSLQRHQLKGLQQRQTVPQDDLHFTSTAFLELQEWELQSLQGISDLPENSSLQQRQQRAIESCQPPDGIPAQCCIGTFGGMGRIIPNRRHQCGSDKNQTAADYMMVRDAAKKEMQHMAMMHANRHSNAEDGGCDVCRLLNTLRHKNWTMALFGDSVSHQTFQGFLCELYRRNYNITETSIGFQYQPSRTRRRKRGQQQRQEEGPHSSAQQLQLNSVDCSGINHCLHLVRQIDITSPLWISSTGRNTQPTVVTVKFFHQYRIPFEQSEQEELVITSADVLVLNFGLHWGANYANDIDVDNPNRDMDGDHDDALLPPMVTSKTNKPTPRHLQRAMSDLLQKIADRGRVRRLFFRETTAQHFNADGGDYSFVKQQHQEWKHQLQRRQKQGQGNYGGDTPVRSLQCVPYQSGKTAGWRERVVIEAARMANFTLVDHPNATVTDTLNRVLLWMPYFEFTSQFSNMHPRDVPASNAGDDCTHYCSSPFLYMPLWRALRIHTEV